MEHSEDLEKKREFSTEITPKQTNIFYFPYKKFLLAVCRCLKRRLCGLSRSPPAAGAQRPLHNLGTRELGEPRAQPILLTALLPGTGDSYQGYRPARLCG